MYRGGGGSGGGNARRMLYPLASILQEFGISNGLTHRDIQSDCHANTRKLNKQRKNERVADWCTDIRQADRPTDGRTHVDVVATSADKLPNRITNDDGAILHYYYQPPKAITKAKTMQTIVLRRDSTR